MGRGRGYCPGHCGHGDPLIDCPKLDDLALLEALTSDVLYVGAIGSLCKWGLPKSSSNQAVDQMLLASCQKVAIRFDFFRRVETAKASNSGIVSWHCPYRTLPMSDWQLRLAMSFVFEGVEENASQRFMTRFDLTMQPWGRDSGCEWLLQAGSGLRQAGT